MADEEETVPKKPMFLVGASGFLGLAVAKAFVSAEDEEGWEVTGTLQAGAAKPKWVTHVVEPTDAELSAVVARSKVIVLDLVTETALSERVLAVLAASQSEEEKVVLGISSLMTWARTSPPALEEGEEGERELTEEEYKRRRPHVNFRDQHTLEKLLVRSKTESVRTHVVCAGLLYGGAEDVLHPLFRLAWENQPLPLLSLQGEGTNIVPTVHIDDLCSALLKLAESADAPAYVVAVDEARNQTLGAITRAIAKHLGTGEVVALSKDEVLLHKDVDCFQLDLRIKPACLAELGLDWVSRAGLVANVAKVVASFRKARGIEPLKVLLLGPLAGVNGCLESEVAAAIAREYRVAHVSAASVVAEALAEQSELADKVRAAKAADKQNSGVLPDELMAQLLRRKLNSTQCANQGWVLDGYPATLAQLRLLAPEKADDEAEDEAEADEGEEEEGEEKPKAPVDLTPQSVLLVRSPDDQLKQRVQAMAQPQLEAAGMSAEQLLKRMQAFAQVNAPEGPHNPLMHKALRQLESLELAAEREPLEQMLARARIFLGRPRNYGPSQAELQLRAEHQAQLKAQEAQLQAQQEAERLKLEVAELERLRVQEQGRMADRAQHEVALLESRSAPLRAFLMAEVIPTLTEGLIEVTKVRPEDPVDFLAEWLFKNNPVLD